MLLGIATKFSSRTLDGFAAVLAVHVTEASQRRQHGKSESDSLTTIVIESSIHILDQNRYPVDTSLIHIESRKLPTKSLFNVGSRRISIVTVNTKEYHSDVISELSKDNAGGRSGLPPFHINDIGMTKAHRYSKCFDLRERREMKQNSFERFEVA
ncbi:hypothetical protein Tco_0539549 [Tanacetum coccineum]